MLQDLNTTDLSQLLLRGLGKVLYSGPEGSVLRQGALGSILTDITDGAALLRILRQIKPQAPGQFAVKSQSAFDALKQEYGFEQSCPCSQWVYTEREAPTQMNCDIRPLKEEHAPIVAEHYSLVEDSPSYIRHRISCGQLWGLFEDGRLAGFIGTHSEGAIGMLEILPQYRRKGYGYALEAWLIARQLAQGWLPYCHVVEGNEASIRLQKKLGMEQARLPALWIS